MFVYVSPRNSPASNLAKIELHSRHEVAIISPYSRQFARHCQARCPYRNDLPVRMTNSRYSFLHARSARATCLLTPAFGFIFGGALRQSRDPLSADAAGASPTQEGGTCGACRETVASPHPRSHPQEAAGCSAPARLGNGRPRLLPTSGTRQPPPSVQGVRLGREDNHSIFACPTPRFLPDPRA